MPDPVLPPEIVVVAKRVPDAPQYPLFARWHSYWYRLPPAAKDSEWQYSSNQILDNTSPADLRREQIDGTIEVFLEYYESVKLFIMGVADNQVIDIGGGFTMSGLDLKIKFQSLSIVITSTTYTPGAAGANTGLKVEINWFELSKYNGHLQEAINFFILHEIAHNTITGISSRSQQINTWRETDPNGTINGPYWGTNQYFLRQERFTNSIAKRMADSINLDITSKVAPAGTWPPYGYESGF